MDGISSPATAGSPVSLHRAPIARAGPVTRLDQAVGAGGVAILAAEPGTGKTEVLGQWRARAPARLPVITVDGAAPRTWAPGLRAVRDHEAGAQGALLVDHAERLPPAYLALLGDALAARSRGLGAVLAGRRDPGLCLVELRRTGPVDELAGADLAWTAGDVADAFARWGRPLRNGDAEDLAWRTDGWAAAVRLAALVGPQVLDADGGPLRDYVLGPALAGVPEDVVAAALRLALADEIDEDIAELLARPVGGAAALLQTLRLRRLFVRPAGDDGASLRFHRLFAQVARRELSAREPSTVSELRRRLRSHLGAGITGALPPAGPPVAIADAAMEDDLLALHAVDLLLEGVLDRPSPAALAALPRATAAGRAAAVLGLLACGDLATAERVLEFGGPADGAGDGAVGDVLAVVALLRLRRRGEREALAEAADALPVGDGDGGRRALAYLELGLLDHDVGDLDAGEAHLQLALGLAEDAGRPALAARARAGLALLSASAGRMRDAGRFAAAATDGEVAPPPDARARAALAHAQVALLRDEIVDARAWATRAREATGCTDDLTLWLDVLFWEVVTLDALGDDDAASARLAEARDIARRAAHPGIYANVLEIYRGRLLERDGREAEARHVLDRLDPETDPSVALIHARRHLREGTPDLALSVVAPWLAGGAPTVPYLIVWLLLMRAAAFEQLGDSAAAHDALEQALAVAEPEGMRRPFADESARVTPLLRAHQRRGTAHAGFVVELLDRIAGARPAPESELRAPLTDRERVVLGFLPAAMTAADIADALIVSEATVRTHLRHIYAKLGARGRREAVRRARELRLLAPEDA